MTEAMQTTHTEQNQPARIYDLIVWGAFFAIAPAVVGTIAAGLFHYYSGAIAGSGLDKLAELILRFGGVWLAVVLYVWWIENRTVGELGLINVENLGAKLGLVFLITGGVIGWPAAWLLAGRAIQAGAEEMLYRGWLLQRVAERRGFRTGVVASSIVFVLAHGLNPGVNPGQLIIMSAYSLVMCLVVRRQGHLWGAIIIHTGWNWLVDIII